MYMLKELSDSPATQYLMAGADKEEKLSEAGVPGLPVLLIALRPDTIASVDRI